MSASLLFNSYMSNNMPEQLNRLTPCASGCPQGLKLTCECKVLTAEEFPTLAGYWERMQQLPGFQDCYKDINFLPIGDYTIEPSASFVGKGTRPPTTFHGQGIKGKK